MLRFLLTRWAKLAYISKLEREAGLQIWMGKVQQAKAAAERKQADDKKADADARESRIKQMAEMEEKGYWECENGHEKSLAAWPCDVCDNGGKWPDAASEGIVNVCNEHFTEAGEIARVSPKPYAARSENAIGAEAVIHRCTKCGASAKLIKRDLMSGQEKYESDKARKESEDLLADLRTQIEAHEEQAKKHEAMVEYFARQAKVARAEADEVRRV